MKKTILLLFIIISLTFVSMPLLAEDTDGKEAVNIALVLDKGEKAKNARYLYSYLKRGLKKAEISQSVNMEFIATEEADSDIFSMYDVVIAVSVEEEKELSDSLLTFATTHKEEEGLFVVALLPKKSGKTELMSSPKDIDILSSASSKKGAVNLVYQELSKKIVAYLEQ